MLQTLPNVPLVAKSPWIKKHCFKALSLTTSQTLPVLSLGPIYSEFSHLHVFGYFVSLVWGALSFITHLYQSKILLFL